MAGLTALAVARAKAKDKPYKLYDQGGLYLLITSSGKYWRYNYRFAGKRKTLAVGVYPEISLAQARKRHQSARRLLGDGIDPSADKKNRRSLSREVESSTFEAVAQEWLRIRGPKSDGGDKRLHRLLAKDLFPFIGNRPVAQIEPMELLKVLRKIQDRGAIDTAHRAKQIASMVFRYAIATGRSERDPGADLKGALAQPKRRHFKAITDLKQLGELLRAATNYSGTPIVKAALRLTPLLFCRPGELRHIEWGEVDFEGSRIELSAQKMKMHNAHIIPLSLQATEILLDLQRLTGNGRFVFPNARDSNTPMSENAVRKALRKLGYRNEDVSPHGFRATARTLLDEQLGYPQHLIEHQLSHTVKDANGRAYNRTTHLKDRREMMQAWSDFLTLLAATVSGEKGKRGGARSGAGRPKEFYYERLLALANEVTLLQRKDPTLSISSALDQLQDNGMLKPQARQRYLTPKNLEEGLMAFLRNTPRRGVLTVLPRLDEQDPL